MPASSVCKLRGQSREVLLWQQWKPWMEKVEKRFLSMDRWVICRKVSWQGLWKYRTITPHLITAKFIIRYMADWILNRIMVTVCTELRDWRSCWHFYEMELFSEWCNFYNMRDGAICCSSGKKCTRWDILWPLNVDGNELADRRVGLGRPWAIPIVVAISIPLTDKNSPGEVDGRGGSYSSKCSGRI